MREIERRAIPLPAGAARLLLDLLTEMADANFTLP